MELMNPWVKQGWEDGKLEGRQEGIKTGRQEGKEELIVRQLNRRFGSVSTKVREQLNDLSSEQLNDLGEALFEFKTFADLETWLSRNNAQ